MSIIIHPHAQARMLIRGATEEDVELAVMDGERFPAKFGRTGFRFNRRFNSIWKGKTYKTKQIEVFAVKEDGNWIIITVIVRYF